MLDLKWIRENPEALDAALNRRGLKPKAQEILALDAQKRALQTQLQALQTTQNTLNHQNLSAEEKRLQGMQLKADIQNMTPQAEALEEALSQQLACLPNIPHPSVHSGVDPIEVKRFQSQRPEPKNPLPHEQLGEALGMMDFKRAAQISGSRFVFLSHDLARLERALVTFMLETHREEGYIEMATPYLVRAEAAYGTGHLPGFADNMFQTQEGHYLIPTAELVLTNWVREQVLNNSELPLRLMAATPCFRVEAGSGGRDVKGMIRMHQFTKVELVHICTPETSEQEHHILVASAERVLQKLDLSYRVMLLGAGDMGSCAQICYDLEVWMPGQQAFREISSCSNCGDYQARRLKTKYHKSPDASEKPWVHTLNGSGLAVGRTLIAILEQYQQEDGSILLPIVLQKLMGQERIAPLSLRANA